MPPLDPVLYVPAFGALAAVIVYQNTNTIPALRKEANDAQAQERKALTDRIAFAETAIPVLTRTSDLLVRVEDVIKKCSRGSA